MIPLMRPTKLTEAKYTKLLKDINVANLSSIQTLLSTFSNSDDLYKHFISKYRYYEIADEDETVFLQLVTDVFDEHKDYYTKLLNSYLVDMDISELTTKTSMRDDSSSGTKTSTGSSTTGNVHKEYDLPNKTINPTDENGYLTAKDTNDGTASVSDSETHSNTYGSSNTSTDNKDFIRLKKEYLAHVRDIYEEFTDRFYDCFLHVY